MTHERAHVQFDILEGAVKQLSWRTRSETSTLSDQTQVCSDVPGEEEW